MGALCVAESTRKKLKHNWCIFKITSSVPKASLSSWGFWVCLNGRGPQGRPRTQNRDYVSLLAWERPSEELEAGLASDGAPALTQQRCAWDDHNEDIQSQRANASVWSLEKCLETEAWALGSSASFINMLTSLFHKNRHNCNCIYLTKCTNV